MARIRIGLALGSGVARGWAHLGVLKAIDRLGIEPDIIAGSRLAGEPPDVSINPRVGHVGLLDFHRADELIELGEAAVERAMPEIHDAIAVFSSVHG